MRVHHGVAMLAAVVSLAGAAIAAPAASARFDLEPQQQPPSQHTRPMAPPVLPAVKPSQLAAIERAKERAPANHRLPNGRYSLADLSPYATASHPDPATPPTVSASGNGFDWSEAAIGAGIAAAIVLLITAGRLAVRQRSQPRHP